MTYQQNISVDKNIKFNWTVKIGKPQRKEQLKLMRIKFYLISIMTVWCEIKVECLSYQH